MPAEISSETVVAVLATARKVESYRKIAREVTAMGYPVSHGTVSKILREEKDKQKGVQKKPRKIPPQNTRPARIKSIEKKILKDIDSPNPPSQRQMARKHKVSQSTIRKIIDEVCEAEVRKKYPVHALSNKQAKQRLDRRPNFIKYLKGEKWKFIVTIDEFWVYPTYVNGQRKVYYKFRGRENCEEWEKNCQHLRQKRGF